MISNGHAVLALDIGSSTIRVAALDAMGTPLMVTNPQKEPFTPNVLLYNAGKFIIGRTAVSERALRPKDVIHDYKAKIGTDEVVFERDGKAYRARDLFGVVIKTAVGWAENLYGLKVKDIVPTVPARWSTPERRDVETAVRDAGFNIKEMPSEPVAAACGYSQAQPGTVLLIVDIGAYTTDISVIKVSEEGGHLRYQVLATEGEPVGGRDIDSVMRQAAMKAVQEAGATPDPEDLTYQAILDERLLMQKEALSELDNKAILIECNGKRITFSLTRQELETMTDGVINRMLDLCPKALAAAKLGWNDITDIIPVGGGCKMPAIIERLKQFGPRVRQDVDADRATVYGAARIGGAAGGLSIDGKLLPPSGLEVSEVVPMDLAILAIDGRSGGSQAFVLVPANSPIPAAGEERFDLMDPGQTKAEIRIVEGKHGAPPSECRELDKFTIDGLPQDSKRGGRIQIKFEISNKGIAEVQVTDTVSGKDFKRAVKFSK